MSDKIRVVVAVDFSDKIMDQIRAVSEELEVERHFPEPRPAAYKEAEILYTTRHMPEPDQAPNLKWIQAHSAGVEYHLRQPIVQSGQVKLTSASGIHAVQMSEYTLGLMLAFAYNVPAMLRLQAQGKWPDNRGEIFSPYTLRGQTLGISGYGSIGRELGRMADALGMTVLATKRNLKKTAAENEYAEPGTGDQTGEIPERFYPPEATASMASECDFLVVTLPHTEATHHAIGMPVFDAMKESGILISIGRGAVINEADLITALKKKKIAGAGLDVFEEEPLPADSPLWKMENVIISPHISGNSADYHEKAAAMFIENLTRYVEKRHLLNVVNVDSGY